MIPKEIQNRIQLLAENIRDGKKASEYEFYNLLKENFFNICKKYSRCDFDAEEAFQKACIKIYNSLSQYNGDGYFCGWLARIFVNYTISEYRANNLKLIGLEYEEGVADDLEEPEFFDTDEVRKTKALYNNLDDNTKSIVYLRVEEDMSFHKISEVLNMSRPTVCRRYNKIVEEIRNFI